MSNLIEKLLPISGELPPSFRDEWLNYSAIGITAADSAELQSILLKEANHNEDDENICSLPIHTWRALYQLNPSKETMMFLLECSEKPIFDNNEWFVEDIIGIIEKKGANVIGLIDEFLSDKPLTDEHTSIINGLFAIPILHPELTTECGELCLKYFKNYEANTKDANAYLVSGMINCGIGLPNIDLIRAAFEAEQVDEFHGDLEDIEIELGLRPPRPIEPMLSDLKPRLSYMDNGIEPIKGRILPNISKKEREKRDAKKKQAKKSKKANRKK
jgi:hypothetical protein